MRSNPKWKDLNFIGGHEKPRDAGNLAMTARRELWEEVPSVRAYERFHLEQLTDELNYRPILSKSKGDYVQYQLKYYFLFKIESSPEALVENIGAWSRNVWVSDSGRVELTGEA